MPPHVTRVADLKGNNRPIDPHVKIPEAVQRAAAAAEAAQRAAYPDQNPEPAPAPPTNPDTIVIAEPAAPTPAPQPVQQPAPQPAPPSAAETVTPPGNPGWAPEVELEFHKIRSAEGRKRAVLENQLNAAAERMAALEDLVQEMKTRMEAAPAPQPPAPAKLITDKETEEFGPDMLDVMGRRAKEIVSPELAELRAMMGTLAQKIDGTVKTVQTNTRASMLSKLDGELPNWREINVLPEFKTWLALRDPLFGVSRHGALLEAFKQNDTVRVLNFFKGFVSEQAASNPANDLPVGEPPAPRPAKPTLDSLAAPGRARMSAQPNAPAEKQIITTADVNAFYAAVRQGFYNGREAEKLALEQELFAAQREGRVRAS